MATWRDVDALRTSEPALTMAEIARRLGCESGWVRATFHRKKWKPTIRRSGKAYPDGVLADHKAGMLYRHIAARHGISTSYVGVLVKEFAPELIGTRRRGPKHPPMIAADLWGADA